MNFWSWLDRNGEGVVIVMLAIVFGVTMAALAKYDTRPTYGLGVGVRFEVHSVDAGAQ